MHGGKRIEVMRMHAQKSNSTYVSHPPSSLYGQYSFGDNSLHSLRFAACSDWNWKNNIVDEQMIH